MHDLSGVAAIQAIFIASKCRHCKWGRWYKLEALESKRSSQAMQRICPPPPTFVGFELRSDAPSVALPGSLGERCIFLADGLLATLGRAFVLSGSLGSSSRSSSQRSHSSRSRSPSSRSPALRRELRQPAARFAFGTLGLLGGFSDQGRLGPRILIANRFESPR